MVMVSLVHARFYCFARLSRNATILHDSPETTLMVLASNVYRESDYVRDYDEFLALAGVR